MSHTRIEAFQEPPEVHEITFNEALITDLQSVGTRVTGINDADSLHTIFFAQAIRMLTAYDPETSDDQLRYALRFITKDVKAETSLFEGSSQDYRVTPATLQTVYPYVPQYGYKETLETQLGIPTRISFDLWRTLSSKDNPANTLILFTQANLWLMPDAKNEKYKQFLPLVVKKDVRSFDYLENESQLEHKLNSPQRSRIHNAHILGELGNTSLGGLSAETT